MSQTRFTVLVRSAVIPMALTFLCATPILMPLPVLAQQSAEYDVERVYLQAYLLMQQGEKLEGEQKFAAAFYKFKEATELFDSVARSHPGWQVNMVTQRRQLVRAKMESVRQLEVARRNAGGAVSADGVVGGGGGTRPTEVRPGLPSASAALPAYVPPASVTAGIEGQLQAYQQRLAAAEAEKAQALQSMEAKEGDLRKMREDFFASQQQLNDSLKKMGEMRTKIETADAKKNRETDTLKKQVAEMTGALEKATQAQKDAATKIDELLGELGQARDTIVALEKDKKALEAEKTQMTALIKGKDDASVQALIAENNRLKAELEKANLHVAELKKDKDAAQKEAAGLREELAKLRTDMEALKQENQDLKAQTIAMRERLEKLMEAPPIAAGGDPALAEENRMLRKIVYSQLKQQTYKESAKRILLDELGKRQIDSENILNQINELAAPPPGLSAQETEMLQDFNQGASLGVTAVVIEKANPEASGDPGNDAFSPPTQDDPTASLPTAGSPPSPASGGNKIRGKADLQQDWRSVAQVGEEAFSKGDAWKAEQAFKKIVSNDPLNVYGLCNLGVSLMAQKKFTDADKILRKATAYAFEDAASHYYLGMNCYKNKDLTGAARSLNQCLQLNPANARAHFALGVVANQLGEPDRAKRHFLEAIQLDASYGEAYRNLAIMNVLGKDFAKAAEYYNRSIELGMDRNLDIEKEMTRQ